MRRLALLLIVLVPLALALAACGTQKIEVTASANSQGCSNTKQVKAKGPDGMPVYHPCVSDGANLFAQRCAGCHTLSFAGTHGSASNVRTRERTDGPNFNFRCETYDRVLYAIENGGFSGAIMPQNIVVGGDARAVASFVAKYAGRKAQVIPGQKRCQRPASSNQPVTPQNGQGSGGQPSGNSSGGSSGGGGSSQGAGSAG
jgi:uncharacterized membrane protein YgcG